MAITDVHIEYQNNLDKWTADEDFFLGDAQVKSKGQTYLPKITADQEDDDYESYKERGLYFGAVGRTVRGLTGAAMLKEPSINLDGRMKGLITTQKVKETIKEELKIGRHGLLVDMPEAADVESIFDVTITQYTTFFITNWETDDETGKLTRVVLIENKTVYDEDGTASAEKIYRELILEGGVYVVKIWESDTSSENSSEYKITKTIIPKSNGNTLDFIPFIFINPIAVSTEIEVSPVQDMVSVAKWHYQRYADYSHALHFTALPTLWATGVDSESAGKVTLGSQTAVVLDNPDAKIGFIEFEGKGLEDMVISMRKAEDYMAFLGARLLEDQKKGVESAETHRLKQGAESATLSSVVDATESGYRLAVEYANQFLGTKVDPETAFSMSRDFVDSKMTPEELTAIMNDWINGGMSYETYYYLKEQGELTQPGRTAEQELDQIESEGPTMNNNDNP